MNLTDHSQFVSSVRLGVGSFVTIGVSLGGVEVVIWLYQCYWEIKNRLGGVELSSLMPKNPNFWDKISGKKVNYISSSPELFEIILDDFRIICIKQDENEDDVGVRMYIEQSHLMDILL